MKEIWRDIEKYDNLYQVSNLGRIKRKKHSFIRKNKSYIIDDYIVSQNINNAGYLCVSLSVNGKVYYNTVHRLVAENFIPNPNNLSDVDHIDNNKENNNVNNLQWISHKDNMNKAFHINDSFLYLNGGGKKRKVKNIEDNKCFNSIREAKRYYNKSLSGIYYWIKIGKIVKL